jgi:hypothetical protein
MSYNKNPESEEAKALAKKRTIHYQNLELGKRIQEAYMKTEPTVTPGKIDYRALAGLPPATSHTEAMEKGLAWTEEDVTAPHILRDVSALTASQFFSVVAKRVPNYLIENKEQGFQIFPQKTTHKGERVLVRYNLDNDYLTEELLLTALEAAGWELHEFHEQGHNGWTATYEDYRLIVAYDYTINSDYILEEFQLVVANDKAIKTDKKPEQLSLEEVISFPIFEKLLSTIS